ncbi:MAG: hypothetical protein H6709_16625 [Kofleriaceae bacterium]|nr:hypothetical protein [Kofleriaceae bacterium]MCB9573707.1 hypothetical protein [Kofleriaceae bacterium]
MSLKSIAVAVAGTLTLGALILLMLDVRAAPAAPNQAKIADARARHKRTAVAPTPPADPWSTARREADTSPPPVTRPRPAVEPTVTPRAPAPSLPRATTAVTGTNLDADPRLDMATAKDEANRLYDRQDFEGAMNLAMKVLANEPGDIRMLRVMVSAGCQMGDADKAKQFWVQLPEHDKNQMARRCQRFGVTFTD